MQTSFISEDECISIHKCKDEAGIFLHQIFKKEESPQFGATQIIPGASNIWKALGKSLRCRR
eukprot:8490740-Ditylum_brightwellii.AAC.1